MSCQLLALCLFPLLLSFSSSSSLLLSLVCLERAGEKESFCIEASWHGQALMAELEVGGQGSGRGRGGDGATGTASGKKKRRSKRREKCGVEGSERPADAQIAKIRQNSVEGCVEYPSASSPVPAVPAKLVAGDEGESGAAANVAAGVGGQYPCKEELSHVVATQAAATCRVAEAKNNAQTCSRVASPPSSLQARAGQPDSSEASEDAAPGGLREGRRERGLEGMGEPVVMDATHGREGGTDNVGARGCDADSLSSHRAAEATGATLMSSILQPLIRAICMSQHPPFCPPLPTGSSTLPPGLSVYLASVCALFVSHPNAPPPNSSCRDRAHFGEDTGDTPPAQVASGDAALAQRRNHVQRR